VISEFYFLEESTVRNKERAMDKEELSIKGFIDEQVEKWNNMRAKVHKKEEAHLSIITLAAEPGSGGIIVAQRVASRLGFDFFHRDLIKEIAKSGHVSPEALETVEKERLSGIRDFIASLVGDRYLWPGLYLEHLTKVLEAISKRGSAVIVGRGSNFILPPEQRFSVCTVAPLELRVQNVAQRFDVSLEEAKQRILNRQSKRESFVKKSFNADIRDPVNYDLTINTARLSVEEAAEVVCGLWTSKYLVDTKQ
jgi:cytidylate kinase